MFINGFWTDKHLYPYSYWWKEVTNIQNVNGTVQATAEFLLHLNSMKVKGSWSRNTENISRFSPYFIADLTYCSFRI